MKNLKYVTYLVPADAVNCIEGHWPVDQIGPLIIRVAQRLVDETSLANWL